METKWNDDEDNALRGLSMLAQLIYLRVFRRLMSYRTGVSGADFRITYQVICDAVGFVPDPGSKKPRWVPTREEVRAAIKELERAIPSLGRTVPLLVDNGSCLHHGYIKKLPLASVDTSIQKGNPTRTPLEPHMTNPAGNDTGKSRKDNGKQSGCSHEQRNEPHDDKNAAPAMNPSTSGNRNTGRTNGAIAPSCDASRFAEFWAAWPTAMRKRNRAKAEEIWKRRKLDGQADMIIADVRIRAEQDQQWLRGFAPMPTTYLNGKRWEDELGGPTASGRNGAASLEERNRAAIAQWLASGTGEGLGDYLEGDFSHERH